VIVEKNESKGNSVWDIVKDIFLDTIEGAVDEIIAKKVIERLPNYSAKTLMGHAKFGYAFEATKVKPIPGVKGLKSFSKVAGPVAVMVYGYEVYQDIKKYDGWDAVKAITVTTVATAVTFLAGFILAQAALPVVATLIVSAAVGIAIGFFADWVKKKWIGY